MPPPSPRQPGSWPRPHLACTRSPVRRVSPRLRKTLCVTSLWGPSLRLDAPSPSVCKTRLVLVLLPYLSCSCPASCPPPASGAGRMPEAASRPLPAHPPTHPGRSRPSRDPTSRLASSVSSSCLLGPSPWTPRWPRTFTKDETEPAPLLPSPPDLPLP